MFSHTQFGLSFLILTFDDRANGYFSRQQVVERLREVDLPEGVQAQLAPFSTAIGEIYRYRVKGDQHTRASCAPIRTGSSRASLRLVPGVADIVSLGGLVKQYEVRPDLAKLRDYKMTLQQLFTGDPARQRQRRRQLRRAGPPAVPDPRHRAVHSARRHRERGGRRARRHADPGARTSRTSTVGAVPRQGIAGQDDEDDIVTGVVLMRRGENPSEVLKAVEAKVRRS